MFNNRELAYLVWGAIALMACLCSKSMRASIADLIKGLFQDKLVYGYLLAATYVCPCLLLLHKTGIWNISMAKDTSLWALFVCLPLIYKAVKVTSFENFVKVIILPLVQFSIIFEFIVGLYSFPFWVEFLIIPLVALLAGLIAYTDKKVQYISVNKVFSRISSAIGLTMFGFVVYHLASNYREYATLQNAIQFLMTFTLSVMILPFLYGISMFTHYENAFVGLKRQFKHKSLYRYAMFKAMLRFHGDIEGLRRWKEMVVRKNMQTRNEVERAIGTIKTLQKSEADPHTVNEELGWSPYVLDHLLAEKGLATEHYTNVLDEEYSAYSPIKKIDEDQLIADTLCYCIRGTRLIATKIVLELKCYHQNDQTRALMDFMVCARILLMELFGTIPDSKMEDAIWISQEYFLKNELATIQIRKTSWHNASLGYGLDLVITHHRH